MPMELIIGAAVGAAVASPKARAWARRGLVYGLAGVLTAYDNVASMTKGAVHGVRNGVNSLREEASSPPPTEAAPDKQPPKVEPEPAPAQPPA
jgi:hypothetical protein